MRIIDNSNPFLFPNFAMAGVCLLGKRNKGYNKNLLLLLCRYLSKIVTFNSHFNSNLNSHEFSQNKNITSRKELPNLLRSYLSKIPTLIST